VSAETACFGTFSLLVWPLWKGRVRVRLHCGIHQAAADSGLLQWILVPAIGWI